MHPNLFTQTLQVGRANDEFLMHFQSGEDKVKNRISTLNCYGVFLASENRNEEAEKAFNDAINCNYADAFMKMK